MEASMALLSINKTMLLGMLQRVAVNLAQQKSRYGDYSAENVKLTSHVSIQLFQATRPLHLSDNLHEHPVLKFAWIILPCKRLLPLREHADQQLRGTAEKNYADWPERSERGGIISMFKGGEGSQIMRGRRYDNSGGAGGGERGGG